jgi:recombination protein RecA
MSEKNKLELLKEKLEKDYGKGIVMTGSSKMNVKSCTTGSISFDKITDCGGIPVGKLIEVFGPESSGKSTAALHIIAEFQQRGKKCLLADYEYSFDKNYATKIGVKVDELIITQPDTMEDGYNIIYEYIKSGEIGLVVIDSHTAMVPKMRMDGEIGDAKMAPEARINSDALKKIKAELEKNDCTVIGISQLRANIGGMGQGNVPTGGNAWKFYPDMRIKIYKTVDKQNETNETVIEIVKNKCGKPYGKCTIPIAWGIGIDKVAEVMKLSVELGIIKKAGSWYSYGENKLGQGSATVLELMNSNDDFYQEIKKKVLDEYSKVKMEVTNENE